MRIDERRVNNDRAAATFAVLVNRLERSMTKRENVASDTALLRMLRTMHHRSGKTLVAVMRKSKPLVASLLNLLVHIGARLVHKRFNRPAGLFAAASFFGAFLPLAGLEGQILAALAFCARFVGTFAGLWAAYRAVDLICGILAERAREVLDVL